MQPLMGPLRLAKFRRAADTLGQISGVMLTIPELGEPASVIRSDLQTDVNRS